MNLSTRATSINKAIKLSLTSKAKQLLEDGFDIIDFSSGESFFDTPEHLKKIARESIDKQFYCNEASGMQELREAIAQKLLTENNINYDYNQVVVCHGAKHGLNNALFTILNDGDEVIIPAPYWTTYPEVVKRCGGIPVYIYTQKEDNFKVTREMLEEVATSKTKALIINNPNNPTGMVYTQEELEEIAEFAIKYDIFVISDESYEKLIYSNRIKYVSIASLNPEIYKRTITINGFSKGYGLSGWRIGYTASNLEIANIISNVQSHTISNVSIVAQNVALEALRTPDDIFDTNSFEFKRKRDYASERISDIPLFSSLTPNGAFYLFIDVSKLFGVTINNTTINDSEDLAKILLDECRVCVVPCNQFGYEKYIRFSYTASMSDLVEGINRIEKFIKSNF
ncbi:MAG: pyridoxal phosphate-dependent aminotransferase [bacterium]